MLEKKWLWKCAEQFCDGGKLINGPCVTTHYMMDGVGRVQFEMGAVNVKKPFSITRSIVITFLIK